MYTCSMEAIYLSLVHPGSWGTFFMKYPVAGHNFLTKLFRLISSMNSIEYEIGFRLEQFFFSVFFFIIHLLHKLNRLHLRSYGRWSSLFLLLLIFVYPFWFTNVSHYFTNMWYFSIFCNFETSMTRFFVFFFLLNKA